MTSDKVDLISILKQRKHRRSRLGRRVIKIIPSGRPIQAMITIRYWSALKILAKMKSRRTSEDLHLSYILIAHKT
jgi:hypothetical protein